MLEGLLVQTMQLRKLCLSRTEKGKFSFGYGAVNVHALVPLTRVLELHKTAKTERGLAGEVGSVGVGVCRRVRVCGVCVCVWGGGGCREKYVRLSKCNNVSIPTDNNKSFESVNQEN